MAPPKEHLLEGPVKEDWFQKLRRPPMQAAAAGVLILLLVGFGALGKIGGAEGNERWGYQAAATGLMLFGVGNALMSLGTDNVGRYWRLSFFMYAILAVLGVGLAYLYSGIWITEAGHYQPIYLALTFGYLVLLSITSMMRGIVSFAEREEWSQPRERNDKR